MWGHRGYGIHLQPRWHGTKTVHYMSIFRDPLTRAVSQFEWTKPEFNKFQPFFRNTRRNAMGSPWRISDSPNVRELILDNFLCSCYLPYVYRPYPPYPYLLFAVLYQVQQLCCWYTYHHDWLPERNVEHCAPSSKATLECAKTHVNELTMVGITEDLDTSTELLTWLTGMEDRRSQTKHANSGWSGETHVLSDKDLVMVREGLQYDILLYEFAKRRYLRDVEKMRQQKSEEKDASISGTLKST